MSYALKFINPYNTGWNPRDETGVLQVLRAMEPHRNVLQYFGKLDVYLGGRGMWSIIWSELCTGSLQSYLVSPAFTNQQEIERIATFWDVLRQVLAGWRHCRYNDPVVMHCDIKISNSMIPIFALPN